MKTNILVSSQETSFKRFIIGTHDKFFHADEVVACAILSLLHSDEQIEIVRSKDISYLIDIGADIMVDVGGGFYDHHQLGGNGKRENDIPYASAGLVWKEFGEELICKCYCHLYNTTIDKKDPIVLYIFKIIDSKLIENVDKEDNGIYTSNHTFSFISSFIPVYNSSYCNYDDSFKLAVNIATQILEKEIFQAIGREKNKKVLSDLIENNGILDYNILEIPSQTFPWLEPVLSYNIISSCPGNLHLIYFVIFPYPSGGWAAQCVPPSLDYKFNQRVPFPK